ncbi:hypothetical protein WMW72_25855 [Paenibacillus filicis]|uniref:Uncharacterized protein n=1 Tax=Paenibacillus filicis TaxID=669464 RepID=A0ABU9DUB5_9BACL
MLQRYSFFGLTLETLLVFGLVGLALVIILGYAFYEHSRFRKQIRQQAAKETNPS